MSKPDKPLLGAFIRAHRERLSPADVGLPPGIRRRAPGLRREEVAGLCGISPTWLAWIEQGRAVSLSPATLANLSGALRLTPAERDYLFNLAGLRDPQAPDSKDDPAMEETLSKAVARLRSPAYALDRDWSAIAWNRPAALLFSEWLGKQSSSRNLLQYMFLDTGARSLVCDWAVRARRLVAEYRADRSTSLQEPACRERVAALRARSPEFDAFWAQQDVLDREGGERTFQHPSQGRIAYQQLTLRVAHAPGIKLVMLI